MAKGPKLAVIVVALVVGYLVLQKTGVMPGGTAKIEGARFAAVVPVFPGATFRETGGGNYYDEIGGPVTFTSKSWYFTMSASVTEVAEFYRANLPAGATADEATDGEYSWTWIPPGAKEGEDVTITVREGELQVTEAVKAGS
jgi:hypothetical protein